MNNPPTSQTEKPAPASMLGGLLLALLVVVGAFFLLRSLVKRDRGNQPAGQAGTNKAGSDPALATTPSPRATAAPSADAQSELLREAPELFRRVQDANNRGDLEELAALSDDGDLLQYFVSSINERNEAPRTKVLAVSVRGNRVLDFVSSAASFTGSIHFKAEIAEGDDPSEVIEEVWHFLKPSGGGTWKLAGIEQL